MHTSYSLRLQVSICSLDGITPKQSYHVNSKIALSFWYLLNRTEREKHIRTNLWIPSQKVYSQFWKWWISAHLCIVSSSKLIAKRSTCCRVAFLRVSVSLHGYRSSWVCKRGNQIVFFWSHVKSVRNKVPNYWLLSEVCEKVCTPISSGCICLYIV